MVPGQYPQYTRADFGKEAVGSSSHRDHSAPQVLQAVSQTHTRLTSRARWRSTVSKPSHGERDEM